MEQEIMEILLENNRLIFEREQLLEEEILRCRSAKNFERDYLNKTTNEMITVYRILDSTNENFKLSGPYLKRVTVVNIITAPEIEMLVIHAEGKYDDYSRKRMKPSDYVKQHLKMGKIKSYEFAKKYFYDVDILVNAIQQYKQKSATKNGTLADLLK
ncbi:hypothetical protein [Metasolibacillus sp. FSL K6-0083]|uniref:hypothetical protein n=1 Tax=Metasolibacillus sp. FSL K6-0083 TaxID=2921416 RepID=UPI00315A1642